MRPTFSSTKKMVEKKMIPQKKRRGKRGAFHKATGGCSYSGCPALSGEGDDHVAEDDDFEAPSEEDVNEVEDEDFAQMRTGPDDMLDDFEAVVDLLYFGETPAWSEYPGFARDLASWIQIQLEALPLPETKSWS